MHDTGYQRAAIRRQLYAARKIDFGAKSRGEHGTSDGGGAPVDKEARKKERRQQKEAKVLKAMEAKKNVPPPVKKEKFVAKAALPACEVEANLEIDVTSLVSTKGFESKDGEPPREKFYLTTAINYTNGDPHIGHAYEAITADVLSRYQRISGKEVFFLTGSDEHGQKIANTAASLGVEPIDICNKYAANFQALNKRLLISNDTYIRTTMEHHKESSRKLWSICAEKGDIYLGKYEGWYDEREEKYVTDSDAEIANFQDAYGTPLKRMSEDSYFFRMGKYTDWLIKHIEDNPQFIQPETHRSGILKRLSSGHQGDLSISRTTFKHGISLPDNFDKEHVIYVWFDALSSYLSGIHALEEADPTAAFWPASVHIIGKDITWFHCVIWPSMLKSAGLTMPKTVFAHGFVSAEDGRKMSKSLGNVVDPHQICNQYPVDTFRWYICRDAIYGCDLSFSKTSLVLSHNSELCDTLGNLVHRSLSLMDKYNAGAVPSRQAGFDFKPFDFAETRREIDKAMDNYALQDACAIAMAALRDTNKFLQDEEPWKRKAPEDAPRRLESVRICLEAVYAVAHFLVAFLPTACTRIFEKLGLAPVPIGSLKEDFTNIPEGTKLTVGSILFQKLELPSDENDAPACNGNGEQAQPKTVASPAASAGVARSGGGTAKVAKGVSSKGTGKPGANAEGDSFTRIEIRVGRVTKMVGSYCIGRYRESNTLLGPANAGRFKVVKVWNHEEADRLYCEEIDVGEDAPREIASGLREHLTLEQFQGSLVLVVCNLRAARLAGFSSNGMVLAAKGLDGKVELVRAPEGSVVGERVRVEGLEGEPLTAAQVKKKKAFEDLAQYLRTDDKCVATYKGEPFLTSGGPCTVDTVTGAPIS